MALETILNQTFTPMQTDSGVFAWDFAETLILVPGKTYVVDLDETQYTCTAVDASAVMAGYTYIGNGAVYQLPGNSEPFAIMSSSEGVLSIVCLTDTAATEHTVVVYQEVEETEPDPEPEPEEPEEPEVTEGIVLKDRNGNDVAYYGIETVTFDTTTEGKQQTYTKGVAAEGVEIVPDFSAGDMPVQIPDNTLIKSATVKMPETQLPENIRKGITIGGVAGSFIGDVEIADVALNMAEGHQYIVPSEDDKVLSLAMIRKPDTLVPENIAEGVDIGGVIGTLAAGGSLARIAIGTISTISESGVTVEHGLGIVPDIVIISTLSTTSASGNFIKNVVGFSTDFKNKIGYPNAFVQNGCYYKNGTLSAITVNSNITTTDTTKPINNANEGSFQTGYRVMSNTYWVVIGGLS